MASEFLRGLRSPPNHKCCICMEDYGTEPSTRGIFEHAVELPCKHIVGSECIEMWLSPDYANRNSCPVCRYQLFPAQPRPYLEHGVLGDDDSGTEDSDEGEDYSEEEDELQEVGHEQGEQQQQQQQDQHLQEEEHQQEEQHQQEEEREQEEQQQQQLQQVEQREREQEEQYQQQQLQLQQRLHRHQQEEHHQQQLQQLRYHHQLQYRQQQQESMDLEEGERSPGEASEDSISETTLHKRVQEWEEAIMSYLRGIEAEIGAVEVTKQLNRSRDYLLYMQLVDTTLPNPVTAQGITSLSTQQEENLFEALEQRGAFQAFVDARPDLTCTRLLWNVLRERGFNYYSVCDEQEVYQDEWRLSSESVVWDRSY